jgi:hypothetical protein
MADRTTSSIAINTARKAVMAVIADFAAYPQWAGAVRSAEVIERDEQGRPAVVRFQLDAGMIKDMYALRYGWDGDEAVRWDLAEPGSVVSAMSGGYFLAEAAGRTTVTYELAVDVRVPMPGLLKRRAEKMIIDTALKGLKTRAEDTETGSGGAERTGEDTT